MGPTKSGINVMRREAGTNNTYGNNMGPGSFEHDVIHVTKSGINSSMRFHTQKGHVC